ncbi:MAG TPA: hypothetical protein VFM02_03675 [Candidatus Paceibacterota bacterium]|nr:hypothetical protein [Candidatus Paceibacterota bacterium]
MDFEKIKTCFYEDFHRELEEIRQKYKNDEHIQFFFSAFNGEEKSLLVRLFDYGVSHLPSREKTDLVLMVYFLLLTELKSLDETSDHFATDAMLWCETGEDDPISGDYVQTVDLQKFYEIKIKPTLFTSEKSG